MSEQDAVRQIIQNYFDALYDGDVEKFRKVFHPTCRLFAYLDDAVVTIDYEPYMDRVGGRPAPASRDDARVDDVVSLTVASLATAHARVGDCYLPKSYLNELTFLKVDGKWRIVSKVFHAFD